jgi:hypothetical protein
LQAPGFNPPCAYEEGKPGFKVWVFKWGNLCRYAAGVDNSGMFGWLGLFTMAQAVSRAVGLLRALTPPDPQLKGAWYPGGFNPCTYKV